MQLCACLLPSLRSAHAHLKSFATCNQHALVLHMCMGDPVSILDQQEVAVLWVQRVTASPSIASDTLRQLLVLVTTAHCGCCTHNCKGWHPLTPIPNAHLTHGHQGHVIPAAQDIRQLACNCNMKLLNKQGFLSSHVTMYARHKQHCRLGSY